MPAVELVMPKMGESIMEATILNWLKKEGDSVEVDEPILEIATDKVDSEVPSHVAGTISKLLFNEGDVVPVGQAIAMIESGDAAAAPAPAAPAAEPAPAPAPAPSPAPAPAAAVAETVVAARAVAAPASNGNGSPALTGENNGFFSPLVLNIARSEQIPMEELTRLAGTGKDNRVTKKDILNYVEARRSGSIETAAPAAAPTAAPAAAATPAPATQEAPAISVSGGDEVIEMDRMRKLIAQHMVDSKATSPHVTSFVEADVTNIVNWRNKMKKQFQDREGEKLTFTPIFIDALVRAIKDFPMINVSVQGDKIIKKKHINVGMAAALPSGNLIVPVIKDADQLNLLGIAKRVNDLADRARNNKLKPDEIEGGTYTISNVGTFGNVLGTPIINQPQVAIMAVGAIRKKPVVIETEEGDTIGIRHMMFLSHSYDHRVVDGFLGGSFVRRMADYLEQWDVNREI